MLRRGVSPLCPLILLFLVLLLTGGGRLIGGKAPVPEQEAKTGSPSGIGVRMQMAEPVRPLHLTPPCPEKPERVSVSATRLKLPRLSRDANGNVLQCAAVFRSLYEARPPQSGFV